jgi:hypothetical protein
MALKRMMAAMGEAALRQRRRRAAAAQRSTNGASLLDLDDTEDHVHGRQQLSLLSADAHRRGHDRKSRWR